MKREQLSDDVTLYLGDCLDILPTLETGSVDAVITDPPYGIGINKSNRLSVSRGFGGQTWDDEPLYQHIEYLFYTYGDLPMAIWGGNYYAHLLPPSRGWLIWDKRTGANSFADCELAWTNIDSVVKMYTVPLVGANAKDTQERYHPTQKPITLMKWILEKYTSCGSTILDPFMGSGTTGVAAVQLGRKFIGIEIDETYYEIAKKRIQQAMLQMRLGI